MTEKQQIEKNTAEKFIKLYNIEMGTFFKIKKLSDYPDIICEDLSGNQLNLEITLTEDKKGDIKTLLGRSNHKTLEYLRGNGMGQASCLSGNVLEQAYHSIYNKRLKDYGINTALVVRDVSPIGWDWNFCVKSLTSRLENIQNPFDKGIWIITLSVQEKIFRIL